MGAGRTPRRDTPFPPFGRPLRETPMRSLAIDLTTLMEAKGPPHGISRLIAQSAQGLLDAGAAIDFIRYSARHRAFVHVDPEHAMARIRAQNGAPRACRVVHPPSAPPRPEGARLGLGGRLYYSLPSEARLPLRNGADDGARAVRQILSGAGALVRALRGGTAERRSGALYRPEPGERVLLASALWGQPGVAAALNGLAAAQADVTSLVCDLLPVRHPEFFSAPFSARFAEWSVATLSASRRILAISRATADDVAAEAARNGIPCPPVAVLRLGDDGIPAAPPAGAEVGDAVRALAERPFVLSLGTIEARKNHHLLYRVWRRLAEQAAEQAGAGTADAAPVPRLVIVGQPGWLTEQTYHALTSDPVLHGHVALVHGADDATISWLLERCLFTLYPSFVEGWGLPVAESLARGRPVIAGTAPSLREAGQGLALHLDPDDVPAWARTVMELAGTPERRQALEGEIARSYRTVTWAETASRLAEALAEGA